jgi:hypothetical protein
VVAVRLRARPWPAYRRRAVSLERSSTETSRVVVSDTSDAGNRILCGDMSRITESGITEIRPHAKLPILTDSALMELIASGRKARKSSRAFLALVLVLLALGSARAQGPVNKEAKAAKASLHLVPSAATILVQHEMQFTIGEKKAGALRWYVNGVPGGNSETGPISSEGLYTAPASVPAGGHVTVSAWMPGRTLAATASVTVIYETQAGNPLRRSKTNPRYFENSGGMVFLTGSHTWNNVRDIGTSNPPTPLDYDAYIAFLKSKNHNYTRLWAWELPKSGCDPTPAYVQPFPWKRTGPGLASDAKPKFDLRVLDSDYFDRLRTRVRKAQESGIFVSVMLFEGYGVIQCGRSDDGFPFYAENNVNGIRAGRGAATLKRTDNFPFFARYFCQHEWVTGTNPTVVEIQRAYVAKVLETLNGFDNVLWEISNEAGANSTNWQIGLIQFIREYEAKLAKQHPIGFTFQYGPTPSCKGQTKTQFESEADWISPSADPGDYGGLQAGPTVNDGKKVIISDTDHLGVIGGGTLWVWKSFMRGMNIAYMDAPFGNPGLPAPPDDSVRLAMGDVLSVARKLPLARLAPSTTACNTGFGMVDGESEYLCLAPSGGTFTLDLTTAAGSKFSSERFDLSERKGYSSNALISGGAKVDVSCPSSKNPCVLHLKRVTKR